MSLLLIQFLLALLAVTGFSVLARWLPIPAPIVLVLGGVALSLIPGVEMVALDPQLFFLVFLPPLLFADGWQMPLREFKRVQRDVLSLALGLVVLTTFLIGVVVKFLVPDIPWGMAFAVGALVSPTDAVAVSAITSKLNLPNRVVTIINGESLVNDASGLVAFRFAVLAVAAGSISFGSVVGSFLVLALGGSLLGLAIGWLVGKVRDGLAHFRSSDPCRSFSTTRRPCCARATWTKTACTGYKRSPTKPVGGRRPHSFPIDPSGPRRKAAEHRALKSLDPPDAPNPLPASDVAVPG